MRRIYKSMIWVSVLALSAGAVSAQKAERKNVREGNKLYESEKYTESEIAYRKSLEVNPRSTEGTYNLGNSLYKQGKFPEAAEQYQLIAGQGEKMVATPEGKARLSEVYHNMGNIFMQNKDYGKAVEVYKQSLRLNPKDDETRYNLALAQKLLSDQQNQDQSQDQQNDDKQENKDQKDDQQQQQQQQNYAQAGMLRASFTRLDGGSKWLCGFLKEQEDKLHRAEKYLQKHSPLLPMFEQSQSIITGLKSALDAQTRIDTYNAHLERLAAQQPVKVKERTDKEAALTRKEQENHTLQNEINLRNKQLETMDRPALQDKKNKLDAGRENLLQALSALSLLAETERTLNEAKENEKALNAKVEACQKQYVLLQTAFDSKNTVSYTHLTLPTT